MGGRVAEEEIFGYEKVTSGASADIKMATGLARAMVTDWGMSDKLGPLLYGDNQDEVFLGHSMMQRQTHLGRDAAADRCAKCKRFVDEGYETAQRVILREHRRAASHRQGAARIRDADRRRDPRPHERQAARARADTDESTTTAGAPACRRPAAGADRSRRPTRAASSRSRAAERSLDDTGEGRARGRRPFVSWLRALACRSSASISFLTGIVGRNRRAVRSMMPASWAISMSSNEGMVRKLFGTDGIRGRANGDR